MVGNGLAFGINIVDGEDEHYAITVPAGGAVDFNDTIFPWCSAGSEVRTKGFRVSNILAGTSSPFMFLYQVFQNDSIAFSLSSAMWNGQTGEEPGDNALWNNQMFLNDGVMSNNIQKRLPSIDILILPDRVVGLPSTTNNQTFLQVLNYAIGITSALGSIAQAAGTIAQAAGGAGAAAGAAGAPAAAASALTSTSTTRTPHRPSPRLGRLEAPH
jgi:hypothetical protein